MKRLSAHRIFYLAILFCIYIMISVIIPSAIVNAEVQRVKMYSASQYMILEFLDDDLLHVEVSAFDVGSNIMNPLYTSPMVYKTDYTGPSYFSSTRNIFETEDMIITVNQQTLALTVVDKTRSPNLSLSTIKPNNLTQALKEIIISKENFTHIYGLGQQFIESGSANNN